MHILAPIQKAYNAAAYSCTKAILSPVMGAFADVLQETVSHSVREGLKEALDPKDVMDFLFGKKK